MVVGGAGDASFEMRVMGEEGPLTELTHANVTYVVASPGEKFTVQVRNLQRRPALAKASLSVDGKDAGYSKKIVGHMKWNMFEGFWVNPTEKRAFVFSTPSNAAEDAEPDLGKKVGIIRVKLVPAEYYHCPGKDCVRCQFLGHESQGVGLGDQPVTKDTEAVLRPDGKKFFMAPSLCVSAGDAMHRSLGTKRVQHTRELPGAVVSVLEVRCEMADILRLRGVLDPAKPEQARLLPLHVRRLLNLPDLTAEAAGTPEDAAPVLVHSAQRSSGAMQASTATHVRERAPEVPMSRDSEARSAKRSVAEAHAVRSTAANTTTLKLQQDVPSSSGLATTSMLTSNREGEGKSRGEASNGGDLEKDLKRAKPDLVDLNLEIEDGDDDCAVLVVKKPKPDYVDCETMS